MNNDKKEALYQEEENEPFSDSVDSLEFRKEKKVYIYNKRKNRSFSK